MGALELELLAVCWIEPSSTVID
eukprot:COSAG03_NODE_19152_length_342_cov_0.415638_1_plen_22_part_10